MKKKIIIGICVVVLLVCFKHAITFCYNEFLISCYNRDNFSVSAKPLSIMNCFESYIAHYNKGNLHFRNKEFEDAIAEYEKALEKRMPEEKECSVRINYALARINTLKEDYAAEENREESIEILTVARETLLEEDCASESGDGHSDTAEKLKSEIDEMLRELQEEQENGDGKDSEQQKEEQMKEEDAHEQEVKEKLHEKQSEANLERKEGMDFLDTFDYEFNFDADGYIW